MCRCNYGLANWQRRNAGTLSLLTHRHNPSHARGMGGERREGGLGETRVATNADLFVCGKLSGRKMEEKAVKKGQWGYMLLESCCYFCYSIFCFFWITQPLLSCVVLHHRLTVYLATPTSVLVLSLSNSPLYIHHQIHPLKAVDVFDR